MQDSIWIKYYEQGALKKEYTFSEIDKLIDLKVIEFMQLGIKHGDRVVIQLPNSPTTVIIYFSIYRLGAIAVPVNTIENKDRLEYIILDCGARAIITVNGLKFLNKDKNTKSSSETISSIIYTSGTTGEPKGVCLSWRNWIANANALIKHHNLNDETIFASPLLLTHCNAHGLAMISTYMARCQWILFDKVTPNFLNVILKEKVSILSVVPSILYSLYEDNKTWRPQKELKYILTAAAPLSADLLSKIITNWKVRVIQGYGLSESTNFSCTVPTNLDESSYKQIMFPCPSIGIALDGVKIKIGECDIEGRVDELLISSDSNFNGYWGRCKLKQEKCVATGDIGYYKIINNQRYYYLKGRIKEIINRGGEKISPIELESELYKVGLNGEFAVISIPSQKYGEDVGLACCQLFDVSILQKIPKYRRPKKVFLLNSLFYTQTGKLQRRKMSDFCKNDAQVIMDDTGDY